MFCVVDREPPRSSNARATMERFVGKSISRLALADAPFTAARDKPFTEIAVLVMKPSRSELEAERVNGWQTYRLVLPFATFATVRLITGKALDARSRRFEGV